MLTLETRLERNPTMLASDLDGEKVMLSVDSGSYYGLADTGGRIWELLAQPRPITEICATLVAEYKVDPATCQWQTLDFLAELVKEGIVRVVPG